MAGMMCPNCGEQTFHLTPTGRKCSRCGHTMTLPPLGGKGGKGGKCSNCKRNTVFNNKCRECGATYSN